MEDLQRHAWMNEIRATFRLAWPLVIAQLTQIAIFTTDIVMMGHLGPDYLAAGSLAFAFFHPIFVFGMGILMATSPLISQAIGRRDVRGVRRITRQGMWVSVLLATLILPIIANGEAILLLFGQTAYMAQMASEYLFYAMWVFYPGLLFMVLRSLVSAHSHTGIVVWVTVAAVIANALGNYALMFGNWGFPRMELRGAGISTVVTNIVMCALLLIYILRHRRFRRYYILVRLWRPDWPRFREILRIGLPLGLMMLAETSLFAAAVMLMGWLGEDELAAHAVALQCAAIAFMVPLGISQAATIRVGIAYGRQDEAAITRAGWVSIVMGTGFMAFTATLFLLMPEQLIRLFLDPALQENKAPFMLAVSFLGVAAIFQLADGAQVLSAAVLRGLSDTKMPMWIAIGGYWLCGMSVSYTCAFILGMGGIGVWIGLVFGLFVVAVALTLRFAMRQKLGLLPQPAMPA